MAPACEDLRGDGDKVASLLNKTSQIIELASNDGYLLQYFVEHGIRVLGIEPAANVAEHALKNSIPTIVKFFGTETASELVSQGIQADLLVGNNVLAHVPKLNDFVEGMKIVLKPHGRDHYGIPACYAAHARQLSSIQFTTNIFLISRCFRSRRFLRLMG